MGWLFLLIAGIFEIVWAVGLKYTHGFTRLVPSLITGAAMILSFWSLSFSLKTIPMSIAYAVWSGIGIAGTALFGILWLGESSDMLKIVSIALILIGIIGLKLV